MKHCEHNNRIVIGILAPFNPHVEKPVGKQTNLMTEFIIASHIHNFNAVIFDPQKLLTAKKKCEGFTRYGSKWIKINSTLPHVIYDRFYSNLKGLDNEVEHIKFKLSEKYYFINPVGLSSYVTDKVKFSYLMKQMRVNTPTIISEQLPENSTQWATLINQPSRLIIKPRFGRMGKGIFRIHTENKSQRIIIRSASLTLIADSIPEMEGIIESLLDVFKLSGKNMMVQEEIQIPEEKYFDIRCLIQRDGSGSPVLTGKVIRCAASKAVAPNIDQGGFAMDIEKWVTDNINFHHSSDFINAVEMFSLDVFRKIENYTGPIGELGVDILVDKYYNLYLIEANAKPGRFAFHRLSRGYGFDKNLKRRYAMIRKRSILNPVMYGRYLMEKGIKNEQSISDY